MRSFVDANHHVAPLFQWLECPSYKRATPVRFWYGAVGAARGAQETDGFTNPSLTRRAFKSDVV